MSAASLAGGLRALTGGAPSGMDRWLARRFEVDAALLVDSGTSALRLAIQSLATAESPSVRVALPAYGCYDLATAAIGADAVVSFYDVDPATLGPDWASLGAVLTAGVDCLVLVHQYGIPADIDRVRALCDTHGVLLIEDAAQGAGAWWRHRRLGARGDLGVLSFGRGKGMTAGGGGALLATGPRGRELLERSRARVASGGRGAGSVVRLAAQALLSHPMLYGVPARMPGLALGDTPFHEPWGPRDIDAAQAGVLQSAAELADEEAGTRRIIAGQLEAAVGELRGVSLVRPPIGDGILPGWLRFPVILERDAKVHAAKPAFKQLGIVAGYPRPLPELPALRVAPVRSWPGAARLADGLVTLPAHRWVAPSDIAAARALLHG